MEVSTEPEPNPESSDQLRQQVLGLLQQHGILTDRQITSLSSQACVMLADEIEFGLPGVASNDDIRQIIQDLRNNAQVELSEGVTMLLHRFLEVDSVVENPGRRLRPSRARSNSHTSQSTLAAIVEEDQHVAACPEGCVIIDLTMMDDEDSESKHSEYRESSESSESSEASELSSTPEASSNLQDTESTLENATPSPTPSLVAETERGPRRFQAFLTYEREALINQKYQAWIRDSIARCLTAAEENVQNSLGRESFVDRYWIETAKRIFRSLELDFEFENFKTFFEENDHFPVNLQVLDWLNNPRGSSRGHRRRLRRPSQ